MPLLEAAPRSLDEYVAEGGGRGLEVALGSPITEEKADHTISASATDDAGKSRVEWPGDGVLQLLISPRVSYFYPGDDGPPIVLQGRVTDIIGAALVGATIAC